MAEHFNVALLPLDENLECACVDFAQANFAAQASEYLLGSLALPHVTLCQFEFEGGRDQVHSVWVALKNLQSMRIHLNFRYMYIKAGAAIHEGKYWIGLAVEPNERLSALQKTVYEKLHDLKIEGKTLPQSYFPHLTMARCDNDKPPRLASLPPNEIWMTDYFFSVSLGISDENGVYRERLYSALG
ncbi:MAG: hypothetical protein P4L53_05360 [Candidatus Obscuribacterales bacterium]|nr:hypothetical protein [Candidatus Obscuribacterales bacterium]